MERKIGLVALAVVFGASLLAGCARPAAGPASAPAAETPQAVNMRITTDTPDVMPQGVAATWFGEELARRIPGSEVKVFNASSLYNNADSLEAMKAGTLEACWATTSKISGIIPEVLSIRMPALFSNYAQALLIPKTDLGEYLENAAAEQGFVWLNWGVLSPYIGVGAKDRILKTADWQGRKVRCYEKALQTLQTELVGASPIVMPWGEFVPSVQSGVVDAGYTSLSSWGPVKETVPYFTCFGIVPDYYAFLVAEEWWNGLSPVTQKVVAEVLAEACDMQQKSQYSSDMKKLAELATTDPTKPGVYLLAAEELEVYKELWMDKVREKAIETIGGGAEQAIALAIATSEELAGK